MHDLVLLDQAVLQRVVICSISDPGWDRCGTRALIVGPRRVVTAPLAEPSPMAARMQPAMPGYARGEVAAGAVWVGDAPLPRHCSVSVFEPGPSVANPATAMQADGAGQATEKLFMSPTPGRSGVGWMRHCIPFHRSARVCGGKPAGAPKASPVAVQADSEVQDTLPMPAPWVPGGVGVGSTLQVVPLSRSASVPVFVAPVVMQAVADWHQMLPRKP